MSGPFRFESVLNVRLQERDAAQRSLVAQLAVEAEAVGARDAAAGELEAARQALRDVQSKDRWRAAEATAWNDHLAQLTRNLEAMEEALAAARMETGRCRELALQAETALKGLEKLKERQRDEQTRIDLKAEERQREDAWQGRPL